MTRLLYLEIQDLENRLFCILLAALDTPTSGKILIDERNIEDFTKTDISSLRLNNFGFVYQFHHLMEDLNCN